MTSYLNNIIMNDTVKEIERTLNKINIKEFNKISANEDYLKLASIIEKDMAEKGITEWEYYYANCISPIPFVACTQLSEKIKEEIVEPVTEATSDDIAYFSIMLKNAASDCTEEYHYGELDYLLTKGLLLEKEKIKLVKLVIDLFERDKYENNKNKYLTLSNALLLAIL